MAIRSKDIALTPEQIAQRRARAAAKVAAGVRDQLAAKKWSELSPQDKGELLRAFALQFGFISPD
jgi:acyl-CoA reductase-like NAD-dependent aldehyde dehydrogenase